MSLLRSFLHISRIFQSLDLLLHEAFFSLHTFPLEPQKALPNLLTQRECLPTTPVNKTLLFKTSEEPQIHLLLSRLCFWAAIEFHNIRTNSACCWKWNVPHTNAQSQLLPKNHESSECGGKRRENFNKWDQTQINSQIHQGGCGRETVQKQEKEDNSPLQSKKSLSCVPSRWKDVPIASSWTVLEGSKKVTSSVNEKQRSCTCVLLPDNFIQRTV